MKNIFFGERKRENVWREERARKKVLGRKKKKKEEREKERERKRKDYEEEVGSNGANKVLFFDQM